MQVIITIGIPGSGKSTYLATKYPTAIVCSADHYFLQADGTYLFDHTKLGEAHQSCLRKFLDSLIAGSPLVAIDNTNLDSVDISPYYALARLYGYEVKVIRFSVAPEVAAARNVHGVPESNVKRMAKFLERLQLPKRWEIEVENVKQEG